MDLRRVVLAGLIASIVMGMMEMVYEAIAGDGFWSPVVYIGATVLRSLQSLAPPVGFLFWGVILGLMGHMMNSVVLTWLFTQTAAKAAKSRGGLVASGAFFGIAAFLVMWYVVLPFVDPVMLNLNATFFFLSHIVWGGALGYLLPAPSAVAQTVRTASA